MVVRVEQIIYAEVFEFLKHRATFWCQLFEEADTRFGMTFFFWLWDFYRTTHKLKMNCFYEVELTGSLPDVFKLLLLRHLYYFKDHETSPKRNHWSFYWDLDPDSLNTLYFLNLVPCRFFLLLFLGLYLSTKIVVRLKFWNVFSWYWIGSPCSLCGDRVSRIHPFQNQRLWMN